MMGKILGIGSVLAIIVIVILVLFFKFGVGNGDGSGDGSTELSSQESVEVIEPENNTDNQDLPNTIIVIIKENQVFVEEKQIEDADELKQYIEEINTDERKFELKEENSIMDTYEWVTKVFDELEIQLIPSSE